jgi:signal transduction histidine kinase
LAVLTGLLALVTLLGYLYQVPIFYGALASYPMAIHTALCFLGLSLGLLLTTANVGFIQLLFNRWIAGLPGQSLIWTSLLVPFLAGWLVLSGIWQGLLSTELAIAWFVVILTLIFTGFIWHTLRLLNQKDVYQQATQQQLEQANAKLLHSNENLQQFAYVASHDLQEPLRKIHQFGDLLKKQYPDQMGEGLLYLDRMQLAANRMSVLIKDLLSFSRVSIDASQNVPVSLSQVLSQVMTDLELRIEETGAVLDIAPLPTLPGDPSQLGQLFQNLLSNALKFQASDQEGNPRIQVRSHQIGLDALPPHVKPALITSQYYQIDVADNGIGFDEKYLDRLFQVFQRLHNKNEFAGTGIGLAICQKVAVNHGGAITASSKPGEGATFSVYLPV